MPKSPKRRCNYYDPATRKGCMMIVAQGRCKAHAHTWDKGLSSTERGYGSSWRALRSDRLKRFPNCERCGEPATEVDHVIPQAEGGPTLWENTMSICSNCHKAKTRRESKRGLQRAAQRRAI